MNTYRAIEAAPDGSTFTLVTKPLLEPDRGRVRIAVEACGICHSDRAGVLNLTGNHPAGPWGQRGRRVRRVRDRPGERFGRRAAMSPLLDGLALHGRLVIVGVPSDPIEVAAFPLIFRDRSIHGSLTGSPAENEDNLAFALTNDVRPMVEVVSLAEAGQAYQRMLSGGARFRMVISNSK